MYSPIDRKIILKKQEIEKKQKEIEELRLEILRLNVLKQEIRITEPYFPEEYFVIPKSILESYLESTMIMFMTVEMEYETLTSKGTVTSGSKGYKMKIHLDNPRVVECQDITVGQYVNMRYNIISQVMDGEYRVQIVVRDVMSTRTCLTYGYVGQDYTSDIQVTVLLSAVKERLK